MYVHALLSVSLETSVRTCFTLPDPRMRG